MKQARKRDSARFSLTSQMRQRLGEGLLLMWGAGATFLLLSLLTYTPKDPGWTNFTTIPHIANWGGRLGAWLADLLFLLLGYIAYVVPLMLLFWVIKGFSSQRQQNYFFSDRLFKGVGLIFLVTSSCGLAQDYWGGYGHLPAQAGGILGYLLSQGLTSFLNFKGSLLLLLTLFLSGVTLTTGFSWLNLIDQIGSWTRQGIGRSRQFLSAKWAKFQTARERQRRSIRKPGSRFLDWNEKTKINKQMELKRIQELEVSQSRLRESKPSLSLVERLSQSQEKIVREPFRIENRLAGLPQTSLLNPGEPHQEKPFSQIRFDDLSQLVEQRLLDFGVEVKVTAVHPGPVITRFELELAPGIKVSKITGLAKDIARSLSVASVRVVEVIPGKSVIGLEIANENREVVSLREILESSQYAASSSPVSLALGKDISGLPTIVDLSKMPHLLVAGTTGSGKSVSLNVMLLSMLYKATPAELRLILIDPKMLELSIYDGIPHLLTPVITDMKDASNALRWCVLEMDKRYRLMASLGVRHLAGYNLKIQEARKQGNPIPPPEWLASKEGELPTLEPLPLIVVVADELADMMMVVGKKVEELVVRLAQKARAAGIHLILATQRPSVDVITGLIKANVPTRIAFQVSSRIDSRTILDQQGAEQLLGHGDMLYLPAGAGIPSRIHGAYVSDEEVHRVVAAWQTAGKPDYLDSVTEDNEEPAEAEGLGSGEADPLYDQAVRIVTESRRASISLIQRRLRIGYNRAARLMEDMETAGLVSSMDSGGSREVLAEPPPLI